MRRAIVLGFLACRPGPVDHPPIVAACVPERVGRVSVEGGPASDVPQLAVLEGTLDQPARTDRIAKSAQEALRAKGYARAAVTVGRRTGCGVELTIAVDRGPRFMIEKIAFATDDEFPDAVRIAAIEDTLGNVNAVGGSYVPDRLQRALAELERRYRNAGWLDAAIDAPAAAFDDARGLVAITIPIRAGTRYRIGNVVARGGKRSIRVAVIQSLGLRGGQWFDAAAVRDGIARARRKLDQRIELKLSIAADRRTIDLEAELGDTP
jgi:outer membrane protein assembly factor BamA